MAGALVVYGGRETYQSTKGSDMHKVIYSLVALMFLSVSTAFAAVPVPDGISAQNDGFNFEQVSAIQMQRADVDVAMSVVPIPENAQTYKQITVSADGVTNSGVASGADACKQFSGFGKSALQLNGATCDTGPPDNAV